MVAERLNSSQRLLNLGEKGVYSSYTFDLDRPRGTDDLEMLGIIRGLQRAVMSATTGQINLVLVLTRQARDMPPLDLDCTDGACLQSRPRVLDAFYFTKINTAVV